MTLPALLCVLASSLGFPQQQGAPSRLDLSIEKRLDIPQPVVSASFRLTEFVGFIATSFKVPLLVETPTPLADLKIPAGTYTARHLLNIAVGQLRGFEWKEENGVAHFYNRQLVNSPGNFLNVRIHRFSFPHDVAEFLYFFRPCISSTIQGYSCGGGAFSGFQPADLKSEPLPYLETFKDVPARKILLRSLQSNGRFYVVIAFDSTHPKLTSQFPYLNWFSQSLIPDEPAPMWVQRPRSYRKVKQPPESKF